jgi:hypothetical protein
MSNSTMTPRSAKSPAANQPPRRPSGSQAQAAENIEADNDALQSVAGGPATDDAADESGNRALHSVATGSNRNVGRDDVERPPRDDDAQGSVEAT